MSTVTVIIVTVMKEYDKSIYDGNSESHTDDGNSESDESDSDKSDSNKSDSNNSDRHNSDNAGNVNGDSNSDDSDQSDSDQRNGVNSNSNNNSNSESESRRHAEAGSIIRSVVFPICIAGSMTDIKEEQEYLSALLESQSEAGNCAEVLKAMNTVWTRRRDARRKSRGRESGRAPEVVGWRDVVQQNGILLLV